MASRSVAPKGGVPQQRCRETADTLEAGLEPLEAFLKGFVVPEVGEWQFSAQRPSEVKALADVGKKVSGLLEGAQTVVDGLEKLRAGIDRGVAEATASLTIDDTKKIGELRELVGVARTAKEEADCAHRMWTRMMRTEKGAILAPAFVLAYDELKDATGKCTEVRRQLSETSVSKAKKHLKEDLESLETFIKFLDGNKEDYGKAKSLVPVMVKAEGVTKSGSRVRQASSTEESDDDENDIQNGGEEDDSQKGGDEYDSQKGVDEDDSQKGGDEDDGQKGGDEDDSQAKGTRVGLWDKEGHDSDCEIIAGPIPGRNPPPKKKGKRALDSDDETTPSASSATRVETP